MEYPTISERATKSHQLLKCWALTALDVYSLTDSPWRKSWFIAKALGQVGRDVPRRERGSLLASLGKWSGHYSVVTRGHKAPWPPAWRLCQRRDIDDDPQSDSKYEYCLTRRGRQWLKRSRTRVELRCGLAKGSVVSEVTDRLGLSLYFHFNDRRGRAGYWVITAPFDGPGGQVCRIELVNGRYRWPGKVDVLIKCEDAFSAIQIIRDRLGMTMSQDLIRDIVAADIGVAFKS